MSCPREASGSPQAHRYPPVGLPERERDAEDGLDQRAELVRLRPVDFEAYLAGREPGELTFEMFELMADLKERP